MIKNQNLTNEKSTSNNTNNFLTQVAYTTFRRDLTESITNCVKDSVAPLRDTLFTAGGNSTTLGGNANEIVTEFIDSLYPEEVLKSMTGKHSWMKSGVNLAGSLAIVGVRTGIKRLMDLIILDSQTPKTEAENQSEPDEEK